MTFPIALRLALAAALLGIPAQLHAAFAQNEPVRGIVRPAQDAWISTELNARIARLPRREGEAFNRGDVLIAFDCDKYATELKAAEAERELNRIVLANSIELDRRKAIGRYEVDQNRARYDKAKAQAETLAVRTKECTIVAPFAGKVSDLKAREFEISPPNQPLMRIVATGNPEIEMIVPSHWLKWIKPDHPFRVKIDETETEHSAVVQRIAATVDSVSQTVKIMAVFTEANPTILPGMSLTAHIRQPAP